MVLRSFYRSNRFLLRHVTLLLCLIFLSISHVTDAQTIYATTATGTINACTGNASVAPNVQSFTASGTGLTGAITITAPSKFEVSLSDNSGFQNSITLAQTGGVVNSTIVYVRSSPSVTGSAGGNVTLASPSASSKTVAVAASIVNAPTLSPQSNIVAEANTVVNDIVFTSTGTAIFNWTNTTPGVGIAASGKGYIPSFTATNTGTSPLVATVFVNATATGFAYVANGSGQVSVINTRTNEHVAYIEVGQNPYAVSVSGNGRYVYVANNSSDDVSVIDTRTNKVIKTIAVGEGPLGVMASPIDDKVYVVNQSSSNVSVIQTSTHTVIATIPVGTFPSNVAVSPDGSRVYVTGSSDDVTIINGVNNKVIKTLAVGSLPGGLAVTPDGSKVYVANGGIFDNTVSVINTATNTVTATIPVGEYPYGVTASADGRKVYVSNFNAHTVSAIDVATNTVTAAFPVSDFPAGVSLSGDGSKLYVVSYYDGVLDVIDTNSGSLVTSVGVGSLPHSAGNFVTDGRGCVSNTVQFTITVNPSPVLPSLDVSAVSGTIYACAGIPSENPDLQTFTITAKNLTQNVSVHAPAGFEVSTAAATGYSSTITVVPGDGTVNQPIYVRSSSSASIGKQEGIVSVTADGITITAVVRSIVRELTTVDAVADQLYANDVKTAPIIFEGTSPRFTWTNSNPSIGLAAAGTGNIPSFQTVNNTGSPVEAIITVTPDAGEYAYITDLTGVTNVIDGKTLTSIQSINTYMGAYGSAVSNKGDRVYTANVNALIGVIDTRTNQLIESIDVPSMEKIRINHDDTRLYAVNENYISMIDATTNKLMTTVPMAATAVAVHPDNNILYVADRWHDAVLVVDANTLQELATIPVGESPLDVVFSPDGAFAYVTSQYDENVSIINTTTRQIVGRIQHAGGETMAISSDGKRLYVGNISVTIVVDLERRQRLHQLDIGARGISLSADNRKIYLAGGTIFDSETFHELARIPLSYNSIVSGDFVVNGTGCGGSSITFKIMIQPTKLNVSEATGLMRSCDGSASSSADVQQQFTVSGSKLAADVTLTAPDPFELSTTETGAFSQTLVLAPSGGTVSHTIYVRTAASTPIGTYRDSVHVTVPGIPDEYVAVSGYVSPVPVANPISDVVLTGGTRTHVMEFSGVGAPHDYSWTNDNTTIGLAAAGTGSIDSFYPYNAGNTPTVATITVTPESAPYAFMPVQGYVLGINAKTFKHVVISTGSPGFGAAVTPDGKYAYITNESSAGTVLVINTWTNTIEATIPVGSIPQGVAMHPDGTFAYVANSGSKSISVIDTQTLTVVNTVTLSSNPVAIAVNPAGTRLYITTGYRAVTILDASTFTEVSSIGIPTNSFGEITFSPNGKKIFISDYWGSLYILDAQTNVILKKMSIGNSGTSGVAFTPDSKYAYVAAQPKKIARIDVATHEIVNMYTIPMTNDCEPFGLSVSPDGAKLVMVMKSLPNGGVSEIQSFDIATSTFISREKRWTLIPPGKSIGKFITIGGCAGAPVTFKMTINPGPAIITSAVTGTITTCRGTPSTDVQQVTVSGSNLNEGITITAPMYFEISTAADSDFKTSIMLPQTDGVVSNTIIYIRTSAAAPTILTTSTLSFKSSQAREESATIAATVNDLPSLASRTLPGATIGKLYSTQITGAPAGTKYSATGLPAGLTINATTGVISGTPTDLTATPATIVVSVDGPCPKSANYSLTVSKTVASIEITNTVQAYNGAPRAVTVTTTPSGLSADVTYAGASTVPTNPGTYPVVVTIRSNGYEGTASSTLTITKGTPSVVITNTSQTYTGSPLAISVATDPAVLEYVVKYNGQVTPPINTGYYSVVVIINTPFYERTVSGALQVLPAAVSFTVSNSQKTYNGIASGVTVVTNPENIAYDVRYNGAPVIPRNTGAYNLTVSSSNTNYSGSWTGTFTIKKATLRAIADPVVRPYLQANPALTYQYEGFLPDEDATQLDEGPSIETTALETSLPGVYPITLRGGSALNYGIERIDGELTIEKVSQSISLESIDGEVVMSDGPLTLVATATSGLPVTFEVVSGPATVSGDQLTVTGEGDVTVQALQAGSEIYEAASASQTFTVHIVSSAEQPTAGPVSLYPNPASKRILITIPDRPATAMITLTDIRGAIVLSTAIRHEDSIAVAHLAKGVYAVTIRYGARMIIQRVVIE